MSEQDVLRELQKISKILTVSNSAAIEKELLEIASTNERKKMWIYTNGQVVPRQIADAVKVTPMTVSLFLNAGIALNLIEYQRGKPPRRVLDYVPPEWLTLVEIRGEAEVSTAEPQSTLATPDKKEGSTS